MNTLVFKHRLLLLICLAIIIDFIPYVRLPFIWTETFFHEISHGISALASGGKILSIKLNYNGSGLCLTQGGIRFLVSFSGYAGSALFGMMLYLLTERSNTISSIAILLIIEATILLALLLWAGSISTYLILTLMLVTFALASRLSRSKNLRYFLKFIAVFVVLDAIRSPLVLIDGRHVGDGATLSNLTFIPEIIWVIIWFLIGLSCLYGMYLFTYHKAWKFKPQRA
jgi:hypothetical protein